MENDNIKLMDLPEIIDADNHEYIIVRQLPVIEERLSELSADISARLSAALSLECTEHNYKEIKKVTASFNKEFKEMEDRRKGVKKAVFEPYERFNETYERLIGGQYKDVIYKLSSKTKTIEDGLKQIKRDDIERYYNELLAYANIDFVPFSRWNPDVNMSVNLKTLKKEADVFVGQIVDAIEILRGRDDRDEVYVEYERTLNLREAIEAVNTRRKAIEEQKQRQAERETQRAAFDEAIKKVEVVQAANAPQALAPPIEVNPETKEPAKFFADDTVLILSFRVKHTRSMLVALKQYLIDNVKSF